MAVNNATDELLAMLLEECGEACQIIGKALRHGLESSHADYGNVPNKDLLAKEFGHAIAIVDLLDQRGVVDGEAVLRAAEEKREKVKSGRAFTHHL